MKKLLALLVLAALAAGIVPGASKKITDSDEEDSGEACK